MEATQEVIVRKIPAALHGIAPSLTSALLDDPKLTDALGLRRPALINRLLVDLVYKGRNLRTRLRAATAEPWFVTGRPSTTCIPTATSSPTSARRRTTSSHLATMLRHKLWAGVLYRSKL